MCSSPPEGTYTSLAARSAARAAVSEATTFVLGCGSGFGSLKFMQDTERDR